MEKKDEYSSACKGKSRLLRLIISHRFVEKGGRTIADEKRTGKKNDYIHAEDSLAERVQSV